MFAQDLRYRVGIKVLRLFEQPVGLIGMSRRLLVQASFGERTKSEQYDFGSAEFAPWPLGVTV